MMSVASPSAPAFNSSTRAFQSPSAVPAGNGEKVEGSWELQQESIQAKSYEVAASGIKDGNTVWTDFIIQKIEERLRVSATKLEEAVLRRTRDMEEMVSRSLQYIVVTFILCKYKTYFNAETCSCLYLMPSYLNAHNNPVCLSVQSLHLRNQVKCIGFATNDGVSRQASFSDANLATGKPQNKGSSQNSTESDLFAESQRKGNLELPDGNIAQVEQGKELQSRPASATRRKWGKMDSIIAKGCRKPSLHSNGTIHYTEGQPQSCTADLANCSQGPDILQGSKNSAAVVACTGKTTSRTFRAGKNASATGAVKTGAQKKSR